MVLVRGANGLPMRGPGGDLAESPCDCNCIGDGEICCNGGCGPVQYRFNITPGALDAADFLGSFCGCIDGTVITYNDNDQPGDACRLIINPDTDGAPNCAGMTQPDNDWLFRGLFECDGGNWFFSIEIGANNPAIAPCFRLFSGVILLPGNVGEFCPPDSVAGTMQVEQTGFDPFNEPVCDNCRDEITDGTMIAFTLTKI